MGKNSEPLNISICTYNLYWKIMSNDPSLLGKKINKKTLQEFKQNLLKNIYLIKNYYNPYFYCFQESSQYQDIIKMFKKSLYSTHITFSKPEHMLTIWQKNIFDKKMVFDGDFEQGRPFSVFVFEDLRFGTFFILINLHSTHKTNTLENIFKPIQNLITANKNKIHKYKIKRILICGDFNRDIGQEILSDSNSNNNFILGINSHKYNFIPFITENKTCCNLNGYGHNKNYDQVIDSFDKPILIHPLNLEKWYETKSSDHIAILAIVKN